MKKVILITDTLFIFPEHEKKLRSEGFEIERLDKPNATEEELIKAIKGKSGYILGGIEKITEPIIQAADQLEAIVFTGTAAMGFILAWDQATHKGIAIASTPHANAYAVAEWHFATALGMVRKLFTLGRTGDKTFETTYGLSDLHVGIIGLGHVGKRLADLFASSGAKKVSYWSRGKKNSSYEYFELDSLLKTVDIVCFCVGTETGPNYVNAEKLSKIKDGTLVTILANQTLNEEDLLKELQTGRLRAFLDWTPKVKGYNELPLDVFFCSNESSAFNTHAANKLTSDWATESIINILKTGSDKNVENPEFSKYRK